MPLLRTATYSTPHGLLVPHPVRTLIHAGSFDLFVQHRHLDKPCALSTCLPLATSSPAWPRSCWTVVPVPAIYTTTHAILRVGARRLPWTPFISRIRALHFSLAVAPRTTRVRALPAHAAPTARAVYRLHLLLLTFLPSPYYRGRTRVVRGAGDATCCRASRLSVNNSPAGLMFSRTKRVPRPPII